MTSSISTTGININYPVAGVDNSSQGFRDNFNTIKTGLDTAATEITALQANSAAVNSNNAFNNNVLSQFSALQMSEKGWQFSGSLATGSTTLDWNSGSYQYAVTDASNGTRTIGFASNFGVAGQAARMTVAIDLVAAGTNYILFDVTKVKVPTDYQVQIVQAGGSGFVPGTITVDANGVISAITVNVGGTGFVTATGLPIRGAGGHGATADITAAGPITNIVISAGGTGYVNSLVGAKLPGRHVYDFVTVDAGLTINLVNYKYFAL